MYFYILKIRYDKLQNKLSKATKLQSLTINIQNETLVEKVIWLLDHFKNDGLEIVSKEDIEDLKLLSATRSEEVVSFDEYLKNTNRD